LVLNLDHHGADSSTRIKENRTFNGAPYIGSDSSLALMTFPVAKKEEAIMKKKIKIIIKVSANTASDF